LQNARAVLFLDSQCFDRAVQLVTRIRGDTLGSPTGKVSSQGLFLGWADYTCRPVSEAYWCDPPTTLASGWTFLQPPSAVRRSKGPLTLFIPGKHLSSCARLDGQGRLSPRGPVAGCQNSRAPATFQGLAFSNPNRTTSAVSSASPSSPASFEVNQHSSAASSAARGVPSTRRQRKSTST
jgi:hypothetical protein